MKIQNPEKVVRSPALETEEETVLAYWTEERMAAAKPLPISVPTQSIEDTHVSTPQSEEGISGKVRGPDEGGSHEDSES